jgi:hypothetical protein
MLAHAHAHAHEAAVAPAPPSQAGTHLHGPLQRGIRQVQRDVARRQARAQLAPQQARHAQQLLRRQRLKHHNVVQAVEEFGAEELARGGQDSVLGLRVCRRMPHSRWRGQEGSLRSTSAQSALSKR